VWLGACRTASNSLTGLLAAGSMALSLLAIQDPLDFNGIENELEPSITCSDFLEDGGHNSTTWMMATSSSSLSGIQLDPATISIESTHSHPQNVWKTGALEDGIPPQHNGGHVPIQSTAEAAEQFAWVYATPDIDGNTGSWCESLEWLPPGDMFPEQETGVLDVLVHCHLDTRQQSVIEGAPDGLPLVDRLGRLNTWQLNLNKALSNNEKQGYGSLMVDSSPTVNALAGFGSGGGQADVASRQGSCEPEHSCGQELEGCSEMEEANNNYGGIGPNLLEVDKVDITSLSPRSIGYGDTADGHIGDSVQAAFVDGPTHVEFTPVASAGLQSCAPRDRRPQHWRRVVCRLFRALLKGPCVDRVWQVTMQGKDQTGSPMYLCNAFLMAVLGEEGGESSAPWPSKLELTDGIPGLMAYFARE
jgi:hypothetical protein